MVRLSLLEMLERDQKDFLSTHKQSSGSSSQKQSNENSQNSLESFDSLLDFDSEMHDAYDTSEFTAIVQTTNQGDALTTETS